MEAILRALRNLGPIGSFLANVLTFLTTNWVVTMATALSIWAGASDFAVGIASDPRVQTGVAVFFVLLWTYIGFAFLMDRRRPRVTRPYLDYAYGLIYEGVGFGWDQNNPEGILQFIISLRNFSAGPVKYRVEYFNIVIARRTLGDRPVTPMAFFLPRGGGRIYRSHPFPLDDVKDLLGKRVQGIAEFSVIYGHPDEVPVRRLKMRLELTLNFNASELAGIADSIIGESDESIQSPKQPVTY